MWRRGRGIVNALDTPPSDEARPSSRLSHDDQRQRDGNLKSRISKVTSRLGRQRDKAHGATGQAGTTNTMQQCGMPIIDGANSDHETASPRTSTENPFRDGDDIGFASVNGVSELESVPAVGTSIPPRKPVPKSSPTALRMVRLGRTFSTRPKSSVPAQPVELESTPRGQALDITISHENDLKEGQFHQSKNTNLMFLPPPNDQSTRTTTQSGSTAEEQLHRVKRHIQNAADGSGLRPKDIDQEFRERGVEGALSLVLDFYRNMVEDINKQIQEVVVKIDHEKAFNSAPAKQDATAAVRDLARQYQQVIHDMSTLRQRVHDAAKGVFGEMEYNSGFARRGLDEILDRLVEYTRRVSPAQKILQRVDEQIQAATRDFNRMEVDYAHKNDGGVEGVLRLLIKDYCSSSNQLKQVEDQIRGILHRIPGKKSYLDAVVARDGPIGAFRELIQFYDPCVEADQELRRVEAELKKVSYGTSALGDFENTRERKGVEGALRLVLNYFQSAVKDLNGKLDGLQKDLKTVRSQNKKLEDDNYALKMTQSRHQSGINDLKRAHREKIDKLQRESDQKLQDAEKLHKEELQRREVRYRADIKRWEQDLHLAKSDHKDELAKMRTAMDSLRAEHQQQKDQWQEESYRREEEVRQQERTENEALREKNQALQGALVARQHIKGLSDTEICTGFRQLDNEVDTFSRLQWEKRKESHWPLSENAMKRSENQRRLRQHIVQSSIWIMLNEKIFHSPFEIFGDYGQSLHREWIDTFGEGGSISFVEHSPFTNCPQDSRSEFSNWPEATEESEDWRLQKVKECSDALKKADSEAKRALKRAYDQSVRVIVNDINDAVDEIAAVSESDRQVVQDFVKMAVQFWLDVSSQKCRIVLRFPPDGVKVLGTRQALTTLQLVVKPEVRRRGNAQGQRLDREQVVKGCEGVTAEFRPR